LREALAEVWYVGLAGGSYMESVARVTLATARFFVDQASRIDPNCPNDREALTNYLQAAIVFMRSITLHLQKQFAHTPGFHEWYAQQQQRLRADRLSRFLTDERNYVLKEGPVNIHRIIEVEMMECLHVSGSASVRIIRGKPWYRQSPKVLLEDAIYPMRGWLRRWRDRRSSIKAAQAHRQASAGVGRDRLFFTEPEWAGTPAIDLLRRQLASLDEIVLEAEARFLTKKS
jgi:hypothetical protein